MSSKSTKKTTVVSNVDAVDRIVDGWRRQLKGFDDLPLRVFGRMNRVSRLLELNLKTFLNLTESVFQTMTCLQHFTVAVRLIGLNHQILLRHRY